MSAKSPPFLLALGLLFWGLYSGFEAVAIVLAAAVEGARWLHVRWDVSKRDFERVADLCAIAFAVALVLELVQSRHFPDSLVCVLVWLPMLFFALILAQRYSLQATVPLSALFWSLRRRADAAAGKAPRMPLDYAYFFGCALAASAANPRSNWFFVGLCALSLYALWPVTARPGGRGIWLVLFAAAASLGFAMQAGLVRAQSNLEEWIFDWMAHRWTAPADPYRARTAIGELGELKTSDRIVLRLDPHGGEPPPRLRTASYTVYAIGTWMSPGQIFVPIAASGQRWEFGRGNGRRARMSTWFGSEAPLLSLPAGTYRLDGLNAGGIQYSTLGALRVDQAPDLLQFEAHFDEAAIADAPPSAADLSIPASQLPALQQVAHEISLPERDAPAAARAIVAFFNDRFTYTLSLSAAGDRPRTLTAFLLSERRGHCEYFATATTLLLRRAGIPARYVTGYAVQEWSPLEGQYVVRARHAHAWSMAWLDGRWQELDTTPSVWWETGEQHASSIQPLYDLLSMLNFRLTVWQLTDSEGHTGPRWMIGAAAILAIYLGWRIWRRQRVRRPAPRADAAAPRRPADRRIAALLRRLSELGHVRPVGEPLLHWADALQLRDREAHDLLRRLLRRYYRARFDPAGLPADEDRLLAEQADRLLHRLRSPHASIR